MCRKLEENTSQFARFVSCSCGSTTEKPCLVTHRWLNFVACIVFRLWQRSLTVQDTREQTSSSFSATWTKPLKLVPYFKEENHGNKDDVHTKHDQYIILESNHVETIIFHSSFFESKAERNEIRTQLENSLSKKLLRPVIHLYDYLGH